MSKNSLCATTLKRWVQDSQALNLFDANCWVFWLFLLTPNIAGDDDVHFFFNAICWVFWWFLLLNPNSAGDIFSPMWRWRGSAQVVLSSLACTTNECAHPALSSRSKIFPPYTCLPLPLTCPIMDIIALRSVYRDVVFLDFMMQIAKMCGFFQPPSWCQLQNVWFSPS
jgi:hypothetical protein